MPGFEGKWIISPWKPALNQQASSRKLAIFATEYAIFLKIHTGYIYHLCLYPVHGILISDIPPGHHRLIFWQNKRR